MNIKVGKKAIEEASEQLSNWGRWGKDDHIGTLNHVTPQDIVNRLNSELNRALAAPDVQARLAQLGLDWKGNTSGEFAAFLRSEVQKWSRAVKESGAKAD